MKTALIALLLSVCLAQDAAYFRTLVPIPPGAGQNQDGYTYLKSSTMLNLFGAPCPLTADCSAVTNAALSKRIVRRTIDKFTYSGADIALDALSRALLKVKAENPALYNFLGNSGMLCCRAIRGSTTSYSNHAWGFAADFNIGGVLDPRGDAKTQRGLALFWPYMQEQGFFWAAGYTGASEDAMHFEIANELMTNFGQSGDWGTCTSTAGVAGRCIDAGECRTTSVSGRCPGPANIKCCVNPPPKKFVCVTATALNMRAAACTTAQVLLKIPSGESLEIVDDTTVTACGNTWQKVRARGAFSGFVATSFVAPCTTPIRPFAEDTSFPEPSGDISDVDAHEDEQEEPAFAISSSPKTFLLSAVFLLVLFFQ